MNDPYSVRCLIIINILCETFENLYYTCQTVTKIISAKTSMHDFEDDMNIQCS